MKQWQAVLWHLQSRIHVYGWGWEVKCPSRASKEQHLNMHMCPHIATCSGPWENCSVHKSLTYITNQTGLLP